MVGGQTFSQAQRLIFLIIFVSQLFVVVRTVPNCNTLNNGTCVACNTGFTLKFATCCANSVPVCKKCSINSYLCDSCINNNYCLNGAGQCPLCSLVLSNCATCTSCSICNSCVSNLYALNTSSTGCHLCSNFMPQCIQCTNKNTCTACTDNAYAISSSTHLCQLCNVSLPNCTNCISQTRCIACSGSPLIALHYQQCVQCKFAISNCIKCATAIQCILCRTLFALVPDNGKIVCAYCLDLMADCMNCSSKDVCIRCIGGSVMTYGCSAVPGCTEVTYSSPTSVCTKCRPPQFLFIPINGTCVCTVGHLAGRFCTEISGCAIIRRNLTGDYCISCNTQENFVFQNSTYCKCRDYFERNGSICQDICGDGMLFKLPCDDGNFIDGDGCSSSCTVETDYLCKGGQNNGKSVCAYKGKMSFSLSCINNLEENTASIVSSVTPFIPNFPKSDLSELIIFNSDKNCTMTNYSISGSQLTIFIKFYQDIQGKLANVTLNYDPRYILSPQSFLSFPLVECNGKPLLYGVSYAKGGQDTIVRLISVFAWIACLAGSFAHKMIGVETIHTFQLIFILQIFAPRYNPIMTHFSQLSNVLNACQRLITKGLINYAFQKFSRLGYSEGFFYNMSVSVLLQFASIVITILLFFIYKYSQFKAKEQELFKPQSSKLVANFERRLKFVYNTIIFPITIGLFLNLFLFLMIRYSYSIFEMTAIIFTVLSTTLIYFNECKTVIVSQHYIPNFSNTDKYVAIYLRNLFILAIVVCITVSDITPKPAYVLSGAQAIYSLLLFAYRPYTSFIHIVGLLINQIGVFLNISWIISQDYIVLTRSTDLMIAYVLLGWMILIIIWSFVRTFYEIKYGSKILLKIKNKKNNSKREKQKKRDHIEAILNSNESQMINYFAKQKLLQKQELHNFEGFGKNLSIHVQPSRTEKSSLLHNEIRAKLQTY